MPENLGYCCFQLFRIGTHPEAQAHSRQHIHHIVVSRHRQTEVSNHLAFSFKIKLGSQFGKPKIVGLNVSFFDAKS